MTRSATVRVFAGVLAAAAVLVGVLVGLSLVGGSEDGPQAGLGIAVAGAEEAVALLAGIPQDGLVLGDPDAPVTLVEYADVQCPFCAQWARDALPAVVERYVRPGRVKLELRGLAFIGPESELGLRAALAASEQDRLWQLVDVMFANQGAENSGWLTEDSLRAMAASIPGLDADRVLDERGSDAVAGLILRAQERAQAAGIPGTPAFEAGPSDGALELLQLSSLDAAGIEPHLDALLEE